MVQLESRYQLELFLVQLSLLEIEANCCSDIGNFSRGLPADVRDNIRGPLKSYYTAVHSEDWEQIANVAKEGSIPA